MPGGADESSFIPHQYFETADFSPRHGEPVEPAIIAMDPENVKIAPAQTPGQAIVERPPEGKPVSPPQGREDFMPVSPGQVDIPRNEFSKVGIKIAFQGKIATEK